MNLLLPLAVVAIAGTATMASAENLFSSRQTQQSNASVHFVFVRSDGAGTVEIRDQDALVWGSEDVITGFNSGLRVQLDHPSSKDLTAFLVVDGIDVASQAVHFSR